MAQRPLPKGTRQPAKMPDKSGIWSWFGNWWGGFNTSVNASPVSEGTVYGLPAAWRCMNWIANAVASCAPPQIHGSEVGVRLDPSPVVEQPWPLLTAHEYWRAVTASLLLYGNFIGFPTDWDPTTGYPRQVIPIHPAMVSMRMDEDGWPIYQVGTEVYSIADVIHIRGYAPPGQLWGLGVIETFRTTLLEGVDQQQYSTNIYAGAGVPPMVISVDRPDLLEAQAEAIQNRFHSLHTAGNKLPAVIPSTMSIETLAFSPQDAQFLESRRWNATEIAWMFGMDPADLGVSMPGSSLTYGNLDQRSVERLTHVLGPWMRSIEQAWSLLLPGGQKMKFNVENLLRTDTRNRLEATEIGLRMGLFTLNDARAIEELPLYPSWADEPWATKPGAEPPPAIGEASPEATPTADPERDPEAAAEVS